jgi:hypothetical protein
MGIRRQTELRLTNHMEVFCINVDLGSVFKVSLLEPPATAICYGIFCVAHDCLWYSQ